MFTLSTPAMAFCYNWVMPEKLTSEDPEISGPEASAVDQPGEEKEYMPTSMEGVDSNVGPEREIAQELSYVSGELARDKMEKLRNRLNETILGVRASIFLLEAGVALSVAEGVAGNIFSHQTNLEVSPQRFMAMLIETMGATIIALGASMKLNEKYTAMWKEAQGITNRFIYTTRRIPGPKE